MVNFYSSLIIHINIIISLVKLFILFIKQTEITSLWQFNQTSTRWTYLSQISSLSYYTRYMWEYNDNLYAYSENNSM